MEITIVFVFVLIFAGFAFLGFYYSKDAMTKRALKNKQRLDIGEVQEGQEVKVTGRLAFAEEPLSAPLSGRPCACWEVIVEEYRSSGKSGSWREIIRDQECQPFYIEDETGRALVRDPVPKLALDKDGHFKSGTWNDASEQLEMFLASRGHQSTGLLGFNKSMRYKEGVFEEGEEVAALGLARIEPDPDGQGRTASYREAPTVVVIEAPESGQVLLSDNYYTLD